MVLLRCRISSTCSMTRRLIHYFRPLSSSSSAAALLIHQPLQNNLLINNQRIQELGRLGRIDDARQLFDEMIQRNSNTWNSMIIGYLRSGRINDAKALFDAFAGKNVVTWTTMVTGYANNGKLDEARLMFDEMPERNVISWNAMISGYLKNGDLCSARILFNEMPERTVETWNVMITGYRQCGWIKEARELFERMQHRSVVTWTLMISGYVNVDDHSEAWNMFLEMHRGGIRPDQSIFVVTLSAITRLNNVKLIETLQMLAIKTNFERDVIVGTAILNAYSRTERLHSAIKFFESMPEKNEFSWTTMISSLSQSGRLEDAIAVYKRVPEHTVASQTAMMSAYAKHGRVHEARGIFEQIPNPNQVTWNAMISGYSKNGMLDEASNLFFEMPVWNSASWAAMISGFAQKGQSEEALKFLSELHRSGIRSGMDLSHSCFTSALFACANIGSLEMGKQVHSLTIKTGCQFNPYVGNGLISMYAKCRKMEDVSQAFNTMRVKDTVSWNSLISALSQNYMLGDARSIFEKMPKRDVVSWTAMISGCAQAGHGDMAFELFLDMLASGINPNQSTLASLLSVCASLGTAKLGKQIHGLIFKLGLDYELFVCNALINMYFKCGCEDAFTVFEEMPDHDVVSWNAVLAGCAHSGFGEKAVKLFEQMKAEGILPNRISFVSVLCACSHAGLVDKGWVYFNSMNRDYGITPSEDHYACMVDLLGRAGHLHEAESFIANMPIEPDSVVWAALLGACRIHQNVELGQRVAERLFQLEPQTAGNYILLSNIYASQGMWRQVGEVRKLMKDRDVTKQPGISWIQIKNKLHSFITADKTHDQTEEIYSTLKEFYARLKMTGYVPDTSFVLHDVEEEQKENNLLHHSEKLAIAYGLLNTPDGTSIQIMKSLRICGDCHTFANFMSKVTQREIVIRDGKRFHHFRNGSCSCGDYW